MSYISGTLWNFITQEDASKVCQNMYNADDRGIESDLVNGYAWDTAIIYIVAMGHNNYPIMYPSDFKNTDQIKNTGDTGDVVCNIYDMSGNIQEWCTEYVADASVTSTSCTRGGLFYNNVGSAITRSRVKYSLSTFKVGFRPIIYIK